MTVTTRIALALGMVLLLLACLATVLPASPQGATCGTWVAPEWTDAKTQSIVDGTEELREQSLSAELSADGSAIAFAAVTAKRLCDDALSTRRTTALVLLVLAGVVPAAVMFVGRGRRDEA